MNTRPNKYNNNEKLTFHRYNGTQAVRVPIGAHISTSATIHLNVDINSELRRHHCRHYEYSTESALRDNWTGCDGLRSSFFFGSRSICCRRSLNSGRSAGLYAQHCISRSCIYISWSLTSLFSTNMAISETKGQGWKVIRTQWRKASDILTSTLAAFLFSNHPKKGKGIERLI